MIKKTKLLTQILLFFLAVDLTVFLFVNREAYLTPYDASFWQEQYENSQWAKGFEATTQMGDAALYAYAGWRQIQGDDPSLINAEQPPVGKYLLGLSLLLFKNPNVLSPLLGLAWLIVIFLIGRRFLKNDLAAAVSTVLLGTGPLFRENLATSMLDLPFAFFISLAFYFFLLGGEKKTFFLPGLFFLGLAAATKIYLAGFALLAGLSLLAFYFARFRGEKNFWRFFLCVPAFFLAFLGSYLLFFLKGKTLFDLKYLLFWTQHFARVRVEGYPWGQIFNIFLLGRWQIWWGNGGIIPVTVWQPFWPLIFLGSLFFAWSTLKHPDYSRLLLLLWGFSFLAMYAFGVPYPRYLLPVLSPFYLMTLSLLFKESRET